MKKSTTLALLLSGIGGVTALQAALVADDFSSGLGNWTSTVILDANGGGSNTAAFQVNSGQLELNTTVFDGIEQSAFIYNGLSLAIGEEVQLDVISFSGNDGNDALGLYVGGTAPTVGVRQDYVTVYNKNSGGLFTRGFDGPSEFPSSGSSIGNPTYETLFIARTDTNTFETGYYAGGVRTVGQTRTPGTPNSADYVGIYSDARNLGTIGSVDNFRVVAIPEPSVALLGGFGFLGLLRRRRA
ncbi:hypothetical protein [Roseibacillus persicicus]|uniref:PEP-CTERM protein-sorting domain-containing protein n=1 Tax=Roseibacillus persicicus TaxID=454148 RepID=A0A918WJJ4_9BACT|nr:hypothetical protein [Roseibacillus persicicus]MDQ8190418.1 hypothetical protein [Roseibacillus persicicus]GHC48745.1 hypothetical protein GCM10007100_13350 [Roseibacillus persicicus]